MSMLDELQRQVRQGQEYPTPAGGEDSTLSRLQEEVRRGQGRTAQPAAQALPTAAEGRTWRKTLPTAEEAEQLQTQRAAAKRANLQPLTRSSAQAEREATAETQQARRQLAGLQRGAQYSPGLEDQITRQQSRVSQAETRESQMKGAFQAGRDRLYYSGLADQRARLEQEAAGLLQPPENWSTDQFMPGGGSGALIAQLVSDHVGRNRAAVSAAGGTAPETLDETTLAFAYGGKYKNLAYLEEGEKKALLAFAAAGQFDKVAEYYGAIERDLNARMHERGRERLNEAPGAGGTALRAVAPVITNLGAPAAYAQAWGTQLRSMGGEYEPVDINKGAISSLRLGNEAQARTIEDLEQAVVTHTGNQGLADAAGFVTETGYSILNNAINLVWGPELALPMMGLQAAGQSTVGALEKGAATGQALATGTLSGAIEVITEKIPVDNLFRLIGSSGGRTTRQAVMEVLKQAGIEATEETVGAYMDLLNDITIMGDKSDYAQYKAQLMEEGLSAADAEREANTRFFVVEPLKNGLAGAISGGVMGGVGTAFSEGSTRIENRRTGRAIDGAYSSMLENGMFSPEAQGARKGAAARLGMDTTSQAAPLENVPLPTYAQEAEALRYLKETAGESPSYTSGSAPGQQATGAGFATAYDTADVGMESILIPSYADEEAGNWRPHFDAARNDIVLRDAKGEEQARSDIIRAAVQESTDRLGDASPFSAGFDQRIHTSGERVQATVLNAAPELEAARFGDLRTAVSAMADTQTGVAINTRTGLNIVIGKDGLKETATNAERQKNIASVLALTDVKSLMQNAVLIGANETSIDPGKPLKRKNNPNRLFQYIFATPYAQNGAEMIAVMRVDAMANQGEMLERFYNLKSVEIKRAESSAASTGFKAGTAEAGAPFSISIADLVAEVNPAMVGNHVRVQEGKSPFKTGGATRKDGGDSGGNSPSALTLLRQEENVKRGMNDGGGAAQGRQQGAVKSRWSVEVDTGAAQADQGEKPGHMTDTEWSMWRSAQEGRGGQAQPDGARASYRGTPATDKLGIRIERPMTDLGASASLRGLERARYEAGKALDRVLKNSHATDGEIAFARGVADGTFTMDQLPPKSDADMIREIADAYNAYNSFNSKVIRDQKKRVNWDFDAEVAKLIKNSDQKQVPSTLSLNGNTMQRNNVRVWGDDAGDINMELFDPVVANEAERIRFVNRMLEKMEPYHLNNEESAMVQRFMEGEVNEIDMAGEGYDAKRLKEAAQTLQGLYSDFYDAINDFLVAHGYKEIGFQKSYAPHMQPEQVDALQGFLQRLGFQTNVNELPTDLAGRTDTFRPGKQYDPYFQHREGTEKVNDAVGGFESYVNYLSNVFYHTDDIQKLRRFSEGLRGKYGAQELSAELDRLNHLEDRLASEDSGLEDMDIQAAKDAAFERFGNLSRFGNYVSVLDDYTNILAGKQSKFDRSVESLFGRKLLNLGRNIQNAFSSAAILGNLSSAINQTVQIPQVLAEVGPKYTARAAYDVATGKTAQDGMNAESDFLTGKTGIQKISEKDIKERVFDFAAKPFEMVDDFASRVIVRAKYLEQVAAGKTHTEALKAADKFASQVVGSRMRGAKPVLFEMKNPLAKLVTTFQLEVANGWAHITQDLPAEIKHIEATQGRGAAIKRTTELIVASQVANFIANILIKSITGREPVPFDGIGMLANYLASGYGMTKEDYMRFVADARPFGTEEETGDFNFARAGGALLDDVLEDLPYISNITSALGITDGRLPLPNVWNRKLTGAVGKLSEAVTAETEEERAAALEQGLIGLGIGGGELLSSWAPMGNQIRKSAQGITALARGGAYSGYGEGEKLQYNVERTPANIVRGALFGKSALPEADKFYAEGAPLLSEKQTDVYQQLRGMGVDGAAAYEAIQEIRRTKRTDEDSEAIERLKVLDASGLDKAAQATIYRGLLASETERELIDALEGEGAAPEKVYAAMVQIRRADKLKDYLGSSGKRTAIMNSGLSDQQKIQLYRGRVSKSRDEDITAVMEAGLGFNDFLKAQNAYEEIKAKGGTAAEKATDFARWLNENQYAGEQYEALREAFTYYSMVPNDGTMYEKLTGAGIPQEQAYSIAQDIMTLEPLAGKESVSTLQRCQVIAAGDLSDKEMLDAMGQVMGETEHIKLQAAYQSAGVPPAGYVQYRERLAQIDENGSVTQAEATAALRGLHLTAEQKAAIWQMQNASWKPWNNPFSVSVGKSVLQAYQGMKQADTLPRFGSTAQQGGADTLPRFGSTAQQGGADTLPRFGSTAQQGGADTLPRFGSTAQQGGANTLPRFGSRR